MKHLIKTVESYILDRNDFEEYDKILHKYELIQDSDPYADVTISAGSHVHSIIDNRDKSHQIIFQYNF